MSSHMAASSFKSTLHFITAALLVVCAIGMLFVGRWRHNLMSKRVDIVEAHSETVMDLSKLSAVPIYDVSTKTTVELKGTPEGPKRLLIFLTAADCASCLDELGDWLSVAKATPSGRFEVDLIYLDTAPNELAAFMNNNPLPYHVYWDERGELVKHIKVPPQTPVTILVDKDFKVLAAQAPEPDMNVRQPFIARVEALVSRPN